MQTSVIKFINSAMISGSKYKTPMSAEKINKFKHPSVNLKLTIGKFVQISEGIVQYHTYQTQLLPIN